MLSTRRVKIDVDLFRQARGAARQAGYSSVREFIEHAIERRLREVKAQQPRDRQSIEERLRGLGYIS